MIEMMTIVDNWCRPYLSQIAMAIIATILVLFGNDINSAIKALIRRYHFIIRTLLFILICAFGYGLLTVLLTPLLASTLAKLSVMWLSPVVLIMFIGLGVYAQRQRHI